MFIFDSAPNFNNSKERSTNYNDQQNKPQINNITLIGNKTLDDLNIQERGNYLNIDCSNADFITNEYLSGISMPAGTKVLLTPVHNTTYTAPANGYFVLIAGSSGSQGFVYLQNQTGGVQIQSHSVSGIGMNVFVPCSKGDIVLCGFNQVKNEIFKFVYAKGTKPQE